MASSQSEPSSEAGPAQAEEAPGRRRRLLWWSLGLGGGGIVVLVLVGLWYLRPIGPIASGYAAKTVCSAHFVSERSVEAAWGDLPDNPLVPFLRRSVDEERTSVTVSLLGMWPSTAWFTPGLGCTLANERPPFGPLVALPANTATAVWPDGAAVDARTAARAAGIDPDALDAAVATAFTEDDPDGRRRNTRAVVVVQDGRIVAERYAEGFDQDTPLIGWSMSKSVTNAMVGRLVQAGMLDLDAPGVVADFVERVAPDDADRVVDARMQAITLDDLMHMTSGLAFEEVYDPDTDATRMLFRPGDTGVYAATRGMAAAPGATWHYSSGTTNIVCDLAQSAAGAGVGMARELVFAPLGMTSAVLEPDASGGLICSSYLYATARDWARFGQWYLDDGVWDGQRLLPSGWVDWSTTPVDLPTGGTPYGAHWWLNEGSDGQRRMASVPADAYWASGNEGQQVVVVPSTGTVVVRLGFTADFDGIDWGLERLVAGVLGAVGEE